MTAPKIGAKKTAGERIVCLTAYDVPTARIADQAGVDIILVGDSVGNVLLGYDSTIPVSMEDMLHHLKAVRKGVENALLVVDMPFGSYQVGIDDAVRNAALFMKAGAEAVKVEGGSAVVEVIDRLTRVGIPVMGHIGMTPQSVNQFGGFRVQGRGDTANNVLAEADIVEQAGAFAVVLELIPAALAAEITKILTIPTIGIGAGPDCDGEIQVFHDIIGLQGDEVFKHTRRFVEAGKLIQLGVEAYVDAVQNRKFPGEENSF